MVRNQVKFLQNITSQHMSYEPVSSRHIYSELWKLLFDQHMGTEPKNLFTNLIILD